MVHQPGRECWHDLIAVPIRYVYDCWVWTFEGRWDATLSRRKDFLEYTNGADMSSLNHTTKVGAMTVEQQLTIDAPCEKVFDALTKDIGKWWAYRASERMQLEAWPGGRFYEENPDGGGFLWGTVLEVRRPKVLRVSELLGSLPSVRAGAHKYELTDDHGKTILTFSCQLLGEVDDEARVCLASGWDELLSTHLRNWVEKGVAC